MANNLSPCLAKFVSIFFVNIMITWNINCFVQTGCTELILKHKGSFRISTEDKYRKITENQLTNVLFGNQETSTNGASINGRSKQTSVDSMS